MTENVLAKLFEHNNWANLQMIEACTTLEDEQLDSGPTLGREWTIRQTLMHLVTSQQGYLSLLTLPVEARSRDLQTFSELRESASVSGAGLLALAQAVTSNHMKSQLRATDGYFVEAWVVLVQSINHATEHGRQIGSMLRALGVTPPNLDGWTHAEVTGRLVSA